jgi:predicted nucleotidyltransferase
MSYSTNILRIKSVNQLLGELRTKVVFVGGATISLYADRPAVESRPTDDVDILVELWSYTEYAAIEDQLRKIGFVNDMQSPVICRFKIQGIIVDVMPTGEGVLGFSNRWYPEGYKLAIDYTIDEFNTVKIFSAPYFLATKLEAFKNRGKNDGRMSPDFEDIIFLLENRRAIWSEIEETSPELKKYLTDEFKILLDNPYFPEWVGSNVDYGSPPSTYIIIDRIKTFVSE